MPLSDHEQRLLEQIERALYADDPKFASTVRGTDLRSHYRRRLVRAVGALLVGLVVMLVGVIAQRWYVGVAGFVIMLLAALRGASAVKRMSGKSTASPRPAAPAKPHASWRERVEERWHKRWEDRGNSGQ
ncbi:MAG: DUF3040 domain-containing protein [Mycobacteriales bacterium]